MDIILIKFISSLIIDGISGALAAFIWSLLLHPLENIRARLQNVKSSEKKNKGSDENKIVFKDNFNSFKYITETIKQEGIYTFYNGLMGSLVGSVFSFGIYFFWYKVFKLALQVGRNTNSINIMLISLMAGVISSIWTNPIWIIQTRMWVDKLKKSITAHWKEIFKEGGILAFWKGTIPGLILVVNPVINFAIYEYLRDIVVSDNSNTPSVIVIFFISHASKFSATILTYPILTLKTKAFTNKGNESLFLIFKNYVKSEGVLALYRGLYTKIFQTLLANSFMMIGLEKIREIIQNYVK